MEYKKIYICGPRKKLHGKSNEAFLHAEKLIHSTNRTAVNPVKIYGGIHFDDFSNNHYMRQCIIAMLGCDLVVTLENWNEDQECCREVDIARRLEIPVASHIRVFEELNHELSIMSNGK